MAHRRFARAVGVPLAFIVPAAGLAGCTSSTQTLNPHNIPYAVIYGHVTTTNGSTSVLVSGQAYLDSTSALDSDSLFGGFASVQVDGNGNYSRRVTSPSVQKLYFDIQAVSTNPAGRDSVMAVPAQLDSIGGTPPHDSFRIDFSLP
jgi:hypothetical protein